MNLVGVLRLLWRRRMPVAAGIGIAIIAATFTAFKINPGASPTFENRQYDVGVASASVLLDSQSSQVVDLGGEGASPGLDVSALANRARLLATLMSTRPLKDQIATPAGVDSRELVTRVTSALPETAPAPVTTGTTVSAKDPAANIMTLQTAETLPIITVNVQAPSEKTAHNLATSAVTELTRYMKSVAASNRVPSARQLVVTPLGPASSATIKKGPGHVWAIAVFLLVLGLWCGAIVMIATVARMWRDADDVESQAARSDPDPEPREAPVPASAPRRPRPYDPARPAPAPAKPRGDDDFGAPERVTRARAARG